MIFDTHAHYDDDEAFDEGRDQLTFFHERRGSGLYCKCVRQPGIWRDLGIDKRILLAQWGFIPTMQEL